MGQTLKNVKVPYPTEGVIRSAQLNDTICPENSVQLAINMNFDRVGAITTRLGVANFATTLGSSVMSFGTLNIAGTSPVYRLFAHVGTSIFVWDGANWTSVRSTLTGSGKARFSQFLDRTWMVNGSSGDVPKTSNGGSFDTTNVPATFPKADFIEAGYGGRIWVADASKDILYYTDIVQSLDGTTYQPLAFTLSTNFISQFSPQDGESITGLFRVPKALLLFKQNHIYRVYSTTNVDPYPAYNVGTFSQESIVQGKDGVYFHHSSGFYKFNYDGQPTEISRRVIDFVRAIPRASYANIVGVYDGFDAVKWSIGAVTVDGVTYSNCQMRYTISTQVWTIYDFGSTSITAIAQYDDGTTIEQIAGTSAGLVGKLDSGYTDFGSDIYYELIDRWRCFTEMYSVVKNISGMMVMTENGAGMELQYRTEKTPENKWENIDVVKDEFDALFPNASTEDFNNIQFRLRGDSNGTPIIYHGTEILSIQIKGLNQN
jgi:hypothetical protein